AVHHVLAILPFEETYFREAGITCTYVGHPLLDEVKSSYDKVHERQRMGIGENRPVIGLLPGSRRREIQEVLPVFLKALSRMREQYPSLQVLLAQAHSLHDEVVHKLLE